MPSRHALLLVAVLIAVVLAGAWVWSSPGYDSMATYLAALIALLGLDGPAVIGKGNAAFSEHDQHLLDQLHADLPFDPPIRFLQENFLGSTFDASQLDALDEFCLKWIDAAHEFTDKRLEEKKRVLMRHGKALMELVGRTTWNIRGRLQSVKSHAGENPAVWEARGEALDAAAALVVEAHQAIVRAGKPKGKATWWITTLVSGLIVAAAFMPAFALYREAKSQRDAVMTELHRVEATRDALQQRVRVLESRPISQVAAPLKDQYRPIREKLAFFMAELDTLGGSSGLPSYLIEGAGERWRDRVAEYLGHCGLDRSYRTEFLAAATEEDERTSSGRWSDAVRKRRAVLTKFLDHLRSVASTEAAR